MKAFSLLVSLLLVGCATARPIPVAPKVIEVQVPVAVSCITYTPEKPVLYTAKQLLSLADDDFIFQFNIDRLKRDIYISELEAVLAGCK